MAYRTECKKTVREFMEILENFLTNPVSMDEPNFSESKGNGFLSHIKFNYDNAVTEEWSLKYDADNNRFAVSGSISGDKGYAYSGQRYDNDIISFTILDGDIAWEDGDLITIKCYKTVTEPFKLINKGIYRKNQKAELQGVKNLDIQDDSGRNNLEYTLNGKLNNHDYILSRADIRCDSINTDYKFNQTDVAIHTSILSTPLDETAHIYLHNFTSDSVTSETTKSIDINLLHSYLNICGTEVLLADYTETINYYTQFTHFTFNITNETGNVDIYINDELFKSVVVDTLKNASYRIYNIFLPAGISFYTWNRLLTSEEIVEIFNNKGFPPEGYANDYYSTLLNDKYFAPYFIVSSTKKFGFFHIDLGSGYIKYKNVLSAKWLPTVGHIGTRYQSWDLYNETGNETYYPLEKQFIDFGELDTVLDQFWIVHDGESILIVLKHLDLERKSNPVYQLYYAGWTIGNNMYDFPVFIGMKSGEYDWYDTAHSDYRFGLTYNKNISVWCPPIRDSSSFHREFGWYNEFVGTTQMSSSWNQIRTTDNFTTIMRIHLYYNYSGNTTQIPYGSPKWLYVINTFDITPETSFFIDGVRYIVIPDNSDSGSQYNYLIELNPE